MPTRIHRRLLDAHNRLIIQRDDGIWAGVLEQCRHTRVFMPACVNQLCAPERRTQPRPACRRSDFDRIVIVDNNLTHQIVISDR